MKNKGNHHIHLHFSFPPPTENFVGVGKEAKQAVWSTADETRVVAL